MVLGRFCSKTVQMSMSSASLVAQVITLVCLAGLSLASFAPVTNPILKYSTPIYCFYWVRR